MNAHHYAEILQLVDDYCDGLYRLDRSKLREVFSERATYATIAGGELLTLSIDEYLERLARRVAPAVTGADPEVRVRAIRFAGDHTAIAEVTSSMFDHDYHDVLSLLRVDGRWRVQAKVFEGTPRTIGEGA